MVDLFKCHTSHPIFPATELLSLWQLRNGGSGYHFQGTFDNKKILIKTLLATNFLCIFNRICQLYETQNHVLTMRTAGDEEPIDLDPEQLSLITQKRCHKLEATRCYNSQKITRRWFGELPNRQHVAERWKMDNSALPLNPSWMETALLFYAENTQVSKEFSKVKIKNISWQSRQERASDRNRSIRVCWNFGHRNASTVTTNRKFEVLGAYITRNWTARTTINLFHRNWTPKFWSRVFAAVVELRARTDARWTLALDKKLRQSQSLYSLVSVNEIGK